MADKEEAISIIEECREIHVQYAAWQQNNPNWREECVPDENTGGPEHHLEWVEKYDKVLEVLRDE